MANSMQSGQVAELGISWVDAHGNPAKVDGVTSWVSSDEAVATVVAAADGLTAELTSVGPVGPVQVQATADADLGAGVQTITAVCDVTVIAGEAVGGEISFAVGAGALKEAVKARK